MCYPFQFVRLGAIALILTFGVISLLGCVRCVISVEEVDKIINDQLPIGSNKQEVKDFIDNLNFDSLRIVRGDFYKANKRKPPVGFWNPEKLAELWDRVEELISVRIIDAKTSFLNRNDIFIEFAIDRQGKLIGYTVKMVGTE